MAKVADSFSYTVKTVYSAVYSAVQSQQIINTFDQNTFFSSLFLVTLLTDIVNAPLTFIFTRQVSRLRDVPKFKRCPLLIILVFMIIAKG